MALEKFPVPEITFFINENPFSGSYKGFNYKIIPIKANAENGIDAHMEAFTWYGPLNSELSDRQAESTFSLDTDGLSALQTWLEEQEQQYRASV